ncbi:MAG: long-chain fatty acid--CoA ligase [Pseudomonadota bacterium]
MIDTSQTLHQLVLEGVRKNENFICATREPYGWNKLDSTAFTDFVRKTALALHQAGIKKGDKVAIHAHNSSHWIIFDLAVMSIGAISIPIYVTQSPEQIEYILDHSETKLIFVSGEQLMERYKDFEHKISHIQKIALAKNPKEGFTPFDEFLKKSEEAQNPEALFEELKGVAQPDDLACISYTSGTTGTPKGVMLSHRNLAHGIQAPMKRCFFFGKKLTKEDAGLSFLPFSHIFEHAVIYAYLKISLPVYIVSDPEMIKEALKETAPLHFTTVPRVLEKIYQNIMIKAEASTGIMGYIFKYAINLTKTYKINERPGLLYSLIDKVIFRRIRKELGGRIEGITAGGAALSAEIMHFFNAIGIPTAQAYGLTETAPGLTAYHKHNLVLGSVGSALEDVEIKICDDGEIAAKGPNIMLGYYKDEEKTKDALRDGWFHTGDVGHIDERGFLFITDRKKELLKLSTGKYIAPNPIENKLATYPFIEQSILVGDRQKFCAVILILTESYRAKTGPEKVKKDISRAIKSINKTLSPWETIKTYRLSEELFSIENGELTPTLKKKRSVIYKNRHKDIQAIYDACEENINTPLTP